MLFVKPQWVVLLLVGLSWGAGWKLSLQKQRSLGKYKSALICLLFFLVFLIQCERNVAMDGMMSFQSEASNSAPKRPLFSVAEIQ